MRKHIAEYRRRKTVPLADILSAAARYSTRFGPRKLVNFLHVVAGVDDAGSVPQQMRAEVIAKIDALIAKRDAQVP